jgi:hypothetical protein
MQMCKCGNEVENLKILILSVCREVSNRNSEIVNRKS